jgi:hypothetical protein
MSNIFMQNNRFNSLIDENKSLKKSDNPTPKIESNRVKEDNKFKQNKDGNLNIPKKLEINESNFPGLGNNISKQNNVTNNTIKPHSFLDKLNTENVEIEKLQPENNQYKLEPGWVEFKRDLKTGRIITNYNKNKVKNINFTEVLDYLVSLHEQRKKEYINNWGEDEYEKMFLFPNYEYGYFDRLDEEEEYETYSEDNEYEDYDYYSDY